MGDNKIIIIKNIFPQQYHHIVGKKHFPSHLMKPMLMTWQKHVLYQ